LNLSTTALRGGASTLDTRMNSRSTKIVFAGILVASSLSVALAQASFQQQTKEWRQKREATLKADDGWLTVSGLFWLKEGTNTFGSAKTQDVVLPRNSAPAKAGTLELHNDIVTLRVSDGVDLKVDKQPVREYEMKFDGEKPPVSFNVGTLNLTVIKRGARFGLRVRDRNSEARRQFKGLRWFSANESYRVTATFTAYQEPKEIIIMNVLGDELKMKTPGLLTFQLHGQSFSLRPVIEDDKLFIIFRDRTSGKTTYGAGRFLYAEMPKDGKVVLDFNRSENPPCAFTPYATCPLPPAQNRMSISISAGELAYHLKQTKQ